MIFLQDTYSLLKEHQNYHDDCLKGYFLKGSKRNLTFPVTLEYIRGLPFYKLHGFNRPVCIIFLFSTRFTWLSWSARSIETT